jgi:N-glycosylase/DNA lyase
MTDLSALYTEIKSDIEAKLREFNALWAAGDDNALLREVCFCVCTPQNNARKAWNAVCALEASGHLTTGAAEDVETLLKEGGVRFHRNKARYIIANRRELFPDTRARIAAIVEHRDAVAARNGLVERVAGWGLKEASHFLRNIGFGSEIAILDRHILRQLSAYGVIPAQTVSKHSYLDLEKRLICFAHAEKIPVDALDLVLWFKEKGELFK